MRFDPVRYRRWSLCLSPLFLIAALASSLFFQGFEVGFFCLTQLLLLAWVLWLLWQVYGSGIIIPRTGLALVLALLWLWLAITVTWSRVPYLSVFSLWWLGSLPLAFWAFTLARDREYLWRALAVLVPLMGVALALTATYQWLVLHEAPRSVFLNINSHAALLNLIALPVAGGFLALQVSARQRPRLSALAAVVFFILVFAVAETHGRGAMLTLLLAMTVLTAVAVPQVPRKALGLLLLLMVIAFSLGVASGVSWHAGGGAALAALSNMDSTAVRLLIWQGAWDMLRQFPWWGIGLGTFVLAYPPYRHAADSSAGFFAHNDYLQIWIEAGLPALLLLLVTLALVLRLCLRILRSRDLPAPAKLEATGLFCGLMAIALHSLVTFNFYILTTLIISGVMLARLHMLGAGAIAVRSWQLLPSRWLGDRAFRTLAVLVMLFPFVYFSSIALAVYETRSGLRLAKDGRLQEADEALARAERFYPYADNILISHADLYRHVLSLSAERDNAERGRLYQEARALLDEAERLNPLRPLNALVRAMLYQQNPQLAGAHWRADVERYYQRALTLNPRFYPARRAYAEFLLAREHSEAARALLEAGMGYWYPDVEDLVPYFLMTAKLRAAIGDHAGAAELAARIAQALQNSGWRRVTVPEQAHLLGVAARR